MRAGVIQIFTIILVVSLAVSMGLASTQQGTTGAQGGGAAGGGRQRGGGGDGRPSPGKRNFRGTLPSSSAAHEVDPAPGFEFTLRRLPAGISIGDYNAFFSDGLRASGIVTDLYGLLVILDRAIAIALQIKQTRQIDIGPNLH